MSKYIYQRKGGPLLEWGTRPPSGQQGRAADARALGSYEPLPKPGAPELILSGDDAITALEKLNDVTSSGVVRKAGALASAYHGYRRNDSVAWALAWAVAGYAAPVLTPVIAVAQGFGKKKGG